MPSRDLQRRMPIFDRLPTAWAFLAGTLLILVVLVMTVAAPISWLHGEWAPSRDFHDVTLEQIVADFESTGVLPIGSAWTSEDLKQRRVTVRYSFYHEPSTVLEIVAKKASIVFEGPAYVGCSICGVHISGPVRIRPAASGEAGVRWVRLAEGPSSHLETEERHRE